MSGADTFAARMKATAERMRLEWKGRRGTDIPHDTYDRIYAAANGITQTMWGRPPTGEQLQHLYDHGLHDPEQVHEAFGSLPHPHAPNLTVADYDHYKQALTTYQQHGGEL